MAAAVWNDMRNAQMRRCMSRLECEGRTGMRQMLGLAGEEGMLGMRLRGEVYYDGT